MTIQKEDIIAQLYANVAVIQYDGKTYTAKDGSGNDVSIDLDAVETEFAKKDYINKRQYPQIGDQLDLLWHAIDADSDLKVKFSAFYNSIKAVKDANPKP